MRKIEVIETRDGSSSLFLPEMNETYHSTHGALTEALYVFLEKGLQYHRSLLPKKKIVKILEIGFGTGLNAWLTAMVAQRSTFEIQYSSLEKYPVEKETLSKLNYTKEKSDKDKALFDQLHFANWNALATITDGFILEKLETDIFKYEPRPNHFDIIYFDAFAPSKQPEMWSPAVLQKMYNTLSERGILTTYCAQGQFKRDLKAAGFEVETLPGPPGKKEMTRGIK